ncbi:uncharacterized protein LOC124173087 [Ischnura elegans]|uniref:uncharacterized protein LOC124173087 n=1 Tax=Ischnura elegans TaxID=197161 RepID=UPI001ED8A251|nr:uncharacterized protein LOC124173087 [Ischnura elegans]
MLSLLFLGSDSDEMASSTSEWSAHQTPGKPSERKESSEISGDDEDSSSEGSNNFSDSYSFSESFSESENEPSTESFQYLGGEKIYCGSSITVLESAVMMMSLFLHFKISYECMSKIIDLLIFHLPKENKVVKSMYSLKMFFNLGSFDPKRFCNNCGKEVLPDGNCCNCPNAKFSNFLICPVEMQIRTLFKRNDFAYGISQNYHSNKKTSSTLENVTHGSLYNQFKHVLSGVFDFTVMLYTDGMQLYKSTKLSVWPILFVINELPYHIRYLPQNIIFGGLWYRPQKPNFSAYTLPMLKIFSSLRYRIEVILPCGDVTKVRCILLNGIADLPAKALLLNLKNFNGFFRCPKCLIKGEKITLAGRKKSFVYKNSVNLTLRTHKESLNHCEEAERTQKPVFGFKGRNAISRICPDFIRGMGIDTMHSVFGGVYLNLVRFVKQLEIFYGPQFMSANVHSLLHLANNVRDLGPAFETSCFPLESLLGTMKKFVSGTQYAELKIIESFHMMQKLPLYVSQLEYNSSSKKFVDSLYSSKKKMEEINGESFVMGKLQEISTVSSFLLSAMGNHLDIHNASVPKVWVFGRLQKGKDLIISRSYIKRARCCPSLVLAKNNSFYMVETFIKFKKCHCTTVCHCESHYYAVVTECHRMRINNVPLNPFITELCVSNEPTSLNVDEILELCVLIKVENKLYCSRRLNTVEKE